MAKRWEERGIVLEFDDEVIALLAKEGYDASFGARPLRRTIQRSVEDALSEEIIAGRISLGDQVKLYVSPEEKIAFRRTNPTSLLAEGNHMDV